MLSADELEQLKKECPNTYQQWIEKLSAYMTSTGRKYSDHLATIRSWALKEKPQQIKQEHHTPTEDIFLQAGQRIIDRQLERGMKGGDLIDD